MWRLASITTMGLPTPQHHPTDDIHRSHDHHNLFIDFPLEGTTSTAASASDHLCVEDEMIMPWSGPIGGNGYQDDSEMSIIQNKRFPYQSSDEGIEEIVDKYLTRPTQEDNEDEDQYEKSESVGGSNEKAVKNHNEHDLNMPLLPSIKNPSIIVGMNDRIRELIPQVGFDMALKIEQKMLLIKVSEEVVTMVTSSVSFDQVKSQ